MLAWQALRVLWTFSQNGYRWMLWAWEYNTSMGSCELPCYNNSETNLGNLEISWQFHPVKVQHLSYPSNIAQEHWPWTLCFVRNPVSGRGKIWINPPIPDEKTIYTAGFIQPVLVRNGKRSYISEFSSTLSRSAWSAKSSFMREEISISGSAKSSFRQQETSLSRARESLILGLVDSSYSVWWWDGSFVAFLFRLLLKSLSDFTELFWTLFYLMLRLLNRFPRFRYFVCYVDMFCPMTWYSVKEHVRDLRWILFVYLAIYMCFC